VQANRLTSKNERVQRSSGECEQVLESMSEFYQLRDSASQRAGGRVRTRMSVSEFERSARLYVAIQLLLPHFLVYFFSIK